jgi:CubicO group peptidase (beta-lactamase class C family)
MYTSLFRKIARVGILAGLLLGCAWTTPLKTNIPGITSVPSTKPLPQFPTPQSNSSPDGFYFPPEGPEQWETISPAEVGWDEQALDRALAYAGNVNSNAIVILYQGRILAERYWNGWDQNSSGIIASASKSVIALLVGQAQGFGLLKIHDPVTKYLGRGWSKADEQVEATITISQLLSMTSGLDKRLKSEAEPGSLWYYNTNAYYKLQDVIETISGQTLDEYSSQHLFEPIGMSESYWRPKSMVASGRDMARFGLLVLAGGVWNGRQLVPDTEYLSQMVHSSQQLNPSYGYLWWLNGQDGFVLPGPVRTQIDGWLIPEAPPDLVAAMGFGDKKIYLIPSLDLVVVRHGQAAGPRLSAASSFDNVFWQKLMEAAPP